MHFTRAGFDKGGMAKINSQLFQTSFVFLFSESRAQQDGKTTVAAVFLLQKSRSVSRFWDFSSASVRPQCVVKLS